MQNKKNGLSTLGYWLLPSATETVSCVFICILTFVLSNMAFFREFIGTPSNFSLKDTLLGSVSSILDRYAGQGITRTGVVILFWALVGLLVYAVIWVLMNFSDELGNDLAMTKYVHPRNVDTSSPLRDFIARTLFRVTILVLFALYISYFVTQLLPIVVNRFIHAVKTWPSAEALQFAIVGLLIELLMLHVLVVLLRFLLLKERIFG